MAGTCRRGGCGPGAGTAEGNEGGRGGGGGRCDCECVCACVCVHVCVWGGGVQRALMARCMGQDSARGPPFVVLVRRGSHNVTTGRGWGPRCHGGDKAQSGPRGTHSRCTGHSHKHKTEERGPRTHGGGGGVGRLGAERAAAGVSHGSWAAWWHHSRHGHRHKECQDRYEVCVHAGTSQQFHRITGV